MDNTTENSVLNNESEVEDQFNLKCKYCLKDLSSRQNLREHLYTHTGEKPYVCIEPGCGQAFRQGSLLSIHKKIHLEIKKTQSYEKSTTKRNSYPKLTHLIRKNINVLDGPLNFLDKFEIKNTISREDFGFISKHLKELSEKLEKK